MCIPYTYSIKFLLTNQYYYGVKYSKNANPLELGTKYLSSSNYVKELIAEHGIENFLFKVRRIFNSKQKAIDWERRVHQKLNVANRTDFLNMKIGNSFKIPSKNFSSRRREICKTSKWYYDPITNKEKFSRTPIENWKIGRSPDIIKSLLTKRRSYCGISNPSFGKKRQDLIERNKLPKVWINKENKTKLIKKEQLLFFINNGWERGRTCLSQTLTYALMD